MKLTTKQLLILSCSFSLVMMVFRILYTLELRFVFLGWNLFLALLPFLFIRRAGNLNNTFQRFILIVIAILFLPNAPYMITDLFHLRGHQGSSIWFDTLLILSFATNGLWLFYLSLSEIRSCLSSSVDNLQIMIFEFTLIFLCSFGMYLGRYLRFNSWDVIFNPFVLFNEITDRLIHPLLHTRTWGMTACYFGFLAIGYLVFIGASSLKSEKGKSGLQLKIVQK